MVFTTIYLLLSTVCPSALNFVGHMPSWSHPKVCQEAGIGRKKSLKAVYQRISCLCVNLEATGWRVFAMRERANQRNRKECCCCGSY